MSACWLEPVGDLDLDLVPSSESSDPSPFSLSSPWRSFSTSSLPSAEAGASASPSVFATFEGGTSSSASSLLLWIWANASRENRARGRQTTIGQASARGFGGLELKHERVCEGSFAPQHLARIPRRGCERARRFATSYLGGLSRVFHLPESSTTEP